MGMDVIGLKPTTKEGECFRKIPQRHVMSSASLEWNAAVFVQAGNKEKCPSVAEGVKIWLTRKLQKTSNH